MCADNQTGFEAHSSGLQQHHIAKTYPFTPIGLHKGWLKGKERILISRSGSYG